jgi:hypothetical protein
MDESRQTRSEATPKDVSQTDQSHGADRRQHPRRACNYQALCRSGGRAWWPVLFIDLSVGGAGVKLSSPIETGAEVTFTVHRSEGRVLTIRARVRHVEPHDGEWLAGCEFDNLLTEEEYAELL